MNIVKRILLPTIILLALDFIYLSINRRVFENQIIQIQRVSMQLNYWSMASCYLLLIAGLYYFILRSHRSIAEAFFLGIVIYGVYETTNYATLKKWSLSFAIMDTLWGGILFALTTFFTYAL